MGLFDFLKPASKEAKTINQLHEKLLKEFPDKQEEDLDLISCISGLLARVAFADLRIHRGEFKIIHETIGHFSRLSPEDCAIVVQIALEDMKELSGIENHTFSAPLIEKLDEKQRYEILEWLFKVAAGDGETTLQETNEIRNITHSLQLTNEHFLAARATVLKSLKELK